MSHLGTLERLGFQECVYPHGEYTVFLQHQDKTTSNNPIIFVPPRGEFVAQLIACHLNVPNYRRRLRVTPEQAIAHYQHQNALK
jgi:hypothetical protein